MRPISPDAPDQDRYLESLESLPLLLGRGYQYIKPEHDLELFLMTDLDLSRLNHIHHLLWTAGRPMRARPLHRYRMLNYDVHATQQMDLHLLIANNSLLLKPLAKYLLDPVFWATHLDTLGRESLKEAALGWLFSYAWLLNTPLDLRIAHDYYLVPEDLTWAQWKAIANRFLLHIDTETLHGINKRYQYGELRLSRINRIYRLRFFLTHFVRGYLYGYNRSAVFFDREFSWVLIAILFLTFLLTAMQVGSSVDKLSEDIIFVRGAYGTALLCMLVGVISLGFAIIYFGSIFVYNMITAVRHASRDKERKAMLLARKEREVSNRW